MSAVVELIKTLTGREVKLVPPTAYLVSPPRPRVPDPPAVEVTVAADLGADDGSRDEPLVVDVSSVVRDGTSDRMILGTTSSGALGLFRGMNVEL